jgi:hypothetical protein
MLSEKYPKFGSHSGRGVCFDRYRAWMLGRDRAWHETDVVDVLFKAAVLSEQEFRRIFGDVPPLPDHAFAEWRSPLI